MQQGSLALAWVPENLLYEFPGMSKEKQLSGDAIRGIIDVGRGVGTTFTLNVYSEFFTPREGETEGLQEKRGADQPYGRPIVNG